MNRKKFITTILTPALLLAASSAMATRKKVSFQHKKNKTLQTDCVEIRGRNDAFPHYTCYDNQGRSREFKPGSDWQQVEVQKIYPLRIQGLPVLYNIRSVKKDFSRSLNIQHL